MGLFLFVVALALMGVASYKFFTNDQKEERSIHDRVWPTWGEQHIPDPIRKPYSLSCEHGIDPLTDCLTCNPPRNPLDPK